MPRHGFTAALSLLCGLVLCAVACKDAGKSGAEEKNRAQAPPPLVLDSNTLAEIAQYAQLRWQGQTADPPSAMKGTSHGVYIAARAEGKRVGEIWGDGKDLGEAFGAALGALRPKLDPAKVDRLEVFLAVEDEVVDPEKHGQRLRSNVHRGIFGVELVLGARKARYSPTYVIASNRKTERLIELFAQENGVSEKKLLREMKARFLLGPQLLIDLAPGGPIWVMERGNELVDPDSVTRKSVAEFAELMIEWMFNNLHQDGRMTYLYWPSLGQEATDRDNLIRQFMATIALGRSARRNQDQTQFDRAEKNIDYNLATYYHEEGQLGVVELYDKVKLGAVALAALAIVEHPRRVKWQRYEVALRRTVDALWQADGSFLTFYKPEGRNDNQNFYPGEALLLWATLYVESKDPALLARFMKSFEYYKKWHLAPENRNPAFIPWHTQAYYMVWRETRSQELADFIFEMNDWLLGVQQWDGVEYPDTRGRFHDPNRPFGPPHASSTGVYLEGLIDAYEVAVVLQDQARVANYRRAIVRGLRSSMQLQFVDEVDMFYVNQRERVRGGLRTTVYDNQIRCDNVQHTLMGTLKILDSTIFDTPKTSQQPE